MAQELDTKNSPKSQALLFPKESKYDRTVPNACIRSALFAVVRKGQRKIFKERKIFSQPGFSTLYDRRYHDYYLKIPKLLTVTTLYKNTRIGSGRQT